MFAARSDQENLAYNHQRAAAAKPLNQALAAKTPNNKAPKTPFRKQLNDENDAFNTTFKTGKKGDGLFTTKAKAPELDKNAFITPAGPRNRAPLGMKTTNAKGALPKTPGLANQSAQKTVSPRMRRPKVKIHHEGTDSVTQEPAVPDIEYMAPRSIPLPDYPEDTQNWDMLRGRNLTAGWNTIYLNPVGADGLTRLDRQRKDLLDSYERQSEATIRSCLDNDPICGLDLDNLHKYFDDPSMSSTARKNPPTKQAPSTLSSKRAAAALQAPPPLSAPSAPMSRTRPPIPHFAAPTATTAARSRSTLPAGNTASSMRHAAAAVASRSTLGYSKGRAVSASARQPLSSLYAASISSSRPTTSESVSGRSVSSAGGQKVTPAFAKQKALLESLIAEDPELEMLLVEKNGEGHVEENVRKIDLFEEDDEYKNFQLDMPEDKHDDEDVKVFQLSLEDGEGDDGMKDFQLPHV